MKKNSIKKLLACTLAISCAIGLLAGCGDNKQKEEEKKSSVAQSSSVEQSSSQAESTEPVSDEIIYPLDTDTKLTLAIIHDKPITLNYPDGLGTTPFWEELQKATGVEVEGQGYADNTAISLMFASGELPDMILYNFGNYNGGVNQAIKDKIIQPITDYLEWAPDMVEAMNAEERFVLAATTSDNEWIGFPHTRGSDFMATSCGLMIREDFLEKVDMEMPNTADELYDVLKAFKEELGVAYPFSCYNNYFYQHGLGAGIFTSAFDLPKGTWYVEDGTVHYGFYEDEYKDVLTYFAKLYDEGLMDPNYSTMKIDVQRANFMNGDAGVTMGAPGGDMGTFLSTMKDDPVFKVAGFGPIVKKDGDVAMSTHYSNPINATFAVITPQCKDIETAMKFLNYAYTEEGHMLYCFGTEGVSYEMVDGYPKYTELITNNPDGWTMQQALAAYSRAGQSFGYVTDARYFEQYQGLPEQQAALKSWTVSNAADYQMPTSSVLEEDSSEYSKLYGDINTYCIEETILFITGKKSLDEYDNYQKTLKEMGMEDCIAIQQRAVDAYLNR